MQQHTEFWNPKKWTLKKLLLYYDCWTISREQRKYHIKNLEHTVHWPKGEERTINPGCAETESGLEPFLHYSSIYILMLLVFNN